MISRSIAYAPATDEMFAGSDCDCACAASHAGPHPSDLDAGVPVMRHPQLQLIALDSGQHAAFVPSASRVAVLGPPALSLLDRLARPAAPRDLVGDEREAAGLLMALGLVVREGDVVAPQDSDTLVAWLHVTNACNLRCTYCYIEKSDEAMSAETALAAVDAIVRSARIHGYRQVRLKYAGGEASLNLPLVEQIHAYATDEAARHGLALTGVVLSNGVGLTREKLRRIGALGLRLMVSLDGPQAVHDAQRPRLGGQGSFAAALSSIERAHTMGLDLTVSVTVTGVSAGALAEIVEWLLDREIHFTLNFYRECDASATRQELQVDQQRLIDGMRAAYRAIERHLPRYSLLGCLLDRTHLGASHRRTCAVGESYLVVDHRGGVAKCQMTIQQTVASVWEPDPLLTIRLDSAGVQNLPVEEKEGCRSCQWRHWCAGGCAVATYRATGRYDVRSPNCEVYKALYPEVVRLEALRILRWHAAAA